MAFTHEDKHEEMLDKPYKTLSEIESLTENELDALTSLTK